MLKATTFPRYNRRICEPCITNIFTRILLVGILFICFIPLNYDLMADREISAKNLLMELFPTELNGMILGTGVNTNSGTIHPLYPIFEADRVFEMPIQTTNVTYEGEWRSELRSTSDLKETAYGTSNEGGFSGFGVAIAASIDYEQSSASIIDDDIENLAGLSIARTSIRILEGNLKYSPSNYDDVYNILTGYFRDKYDELCALWGETPLPQQKIIALQEEIYEEFGDSVVIHNDLIQAGCILITRTHHGNALTATEDFAFGVAAGGYGANLSTSNSWHKQNSNSYNLSDTKITYYQIGDTFSDVQTTASDLQGNTSLTQFPSPSSKAAPSAPTLPNIDKKETIEPKPLPTVTEIQDKRVEGVKRREMMEKGLDGSGNDPWTGSWSGFVAAIEDMSKAANRAAVPTYDVDQALLFAKQANNGQVEGSISSNVIKKMTKKPSRSYYVDKNDIYTTWQVYNIKTMPLSEIFPCFQRPVGSPQTVWLGMCWQEVAKVEDFIRYLDNMYSLFGSYLAVDDQEDYDTGITAMNKSIADLRTKLISNYSPEQGTDTQIDGNLTEDEKKAYHAERLYQFVCMTITTALQDASLYETYNGVWQKIKEYPYGKISSKWSEETVQILPLLLDINGAVRVVAVGFVNGFRYERDCIYALDYCDYYPVKCLKGGMIASSGEAVLGQFLFNPCANDDYGETGYFQPQTECFFKPLNHKYGDKIEMTKHSGYGQKDWYASHGFDFDFEEHGFMFFEAKDKGWTDSFAANNKRYVNGFTTPEDDYQAGVGRPQLSLYDVGFSKSYSVVLDNYLKSISNDDI